MEELQAGSAAGRWKEEAGGEEEEGEDSSGRVEKALEFKERMTPVSRVISSTTLNGRSNEAATVEVRGGSFSSSSDPVRRQGVTAKKGRPPQLFSQAVAPSSTEQGGVFGNLSQRQDNDNDDVVTKKKKLPAKQNPSTSTHDAPPHPQGGGLPRPTYRRPQQQQQQQGSSYGYDSSVEGAAASGMTLKKKKTKKEPAGMVVVPADQGFSMITHAGERSPSSSFFSNELGIPPHLQAPPDHYQDFSMITQAGERPPFDEFGIPLHLKASPDHHHQDFSMITQAGEKPSFDEAAEAVAETFRISASSPLTEEMRLTSFHLSLIRDCSLPIRAASTKELEQTVDTRINTAHLMLDMYLYTSQHDRENSISNSSSSISSRDLGVGTPCQPIMTKVSNR
jgi:hypothetical protein